MGEPAPSGLRWFFDQFGPEKTGLNFERFAAVALVAYALAQALGPVFAPHAAPGDDLDHELEMLRRVVERDPHHPLLVGITLLFFVAIGAMIVILSRIVRRSRATPPKPLFPPEEDPTRIPPRWGLADFGLLLFFQLIVGGMVLGLAMPALAVEGGPRINLLRGTASWNTTGVVAITSATQAAALRSDTPELARVVAEELTGVLEVAPLQTSGSVVLRNGSPLAPGAYPLEPGDRIQVGATSARFEGTSFVGFCWLQVLVGSIMTLLLIAIVRARGDTLADLGMKLEGAPREAARGVLGYLGGLPLIYATIFAWTAFCRAAKVPVESHVLLKHLETDQSPAAIASVVILAAVAAPIFEEILYRGFLTRAMRRPFSSRIAAAGLASLFFGALHTGFASLLPISVVGAVFAAVFLTSRRLSLVGAIVAHACFNGTQIAIDLTLLRAGA